MHSFHRSRGRILFEIACALAISGSCVAAWMQTGASAFVPAAAVAALFGFVHLFDLRGVNRARPAGQPASEVAVALPAEIPDVKYVGLSIVESGVPSSGGGASDEAEPADATAAPGKARPAKARRKVRASRAKASTKPKSVEPKPVEDAEAAVPTVWDEAPQPPIAPLFEPDPFVRQQRTIFGRKAG